MSGEGQQKKTMIMDGKHEEALMNALVQEAWNKAVVPDIMIVGEQNFLMMRREGAAMDARKKFAGRNWRRIKREMNRARQRVGREKRNRP